MQEHTSHPWNFQCLIPPKTQIQGCLCQLNTDSAVLSTAEVLTKPNLYKREPRTSQAPKEEVPSTGYTGKEHSSRDRHSAALRVNLGCWEPQETLLLPGHLVEQLRMLQLIIRPKITEWTPSQRGASPHNSELLMWELGRGGGFVHLPAFSGGLYLLLLINPWRYLNAGYLDCLKGIWGWTEIIWPQLLSRLHRYLL